MRQVAYIPADAERPTQSLSVAGAQSLGYVDVAFSSSATAHTTDSTGDANRNRQTPIASRYPFTLIVKALEQSLN